MAQTKKPITRRGSLTGWDVAGGHATRDLERLLGLVADGRLDPGVDYEGSWRDAAAAMAARGKAVLLVD